MVREDPHVIPYVRNIQKLSSICRNLADGVKNGLNAYASICNKIVYITKLISEALDNNKQVDVIYAAFSKTFNRVDHCNLLKKLEAMVLRMNTNTL